MRIQLLMLYLLTGLGTGAYAQEMWGAAPGNYAGQMGIDLNPASIADAPYRWEIHFVSLDASILNNYMYLKGDSRLIRKSVKGESVEEDKFTDRYTRNPDKFAYGSAFLKYPAFIWSGKKLSAAFHVSTRAELSASKVPYHLAKYLKEGFDYNPQQNTNYAVRNLRAGLLTWHEFGVTIAGVLHDSKEYFWTGGVTLNYNYGLTGVYVRLDDADYILPADTLLIVNNIQAEYGHALPDNGTRGSNDPLAKRGKGYSFTAGVQFFKNRNEAFFNPCKRNNGEKPYDYRLGVSLMDIGYLHYTEGTRTYLFDNRNTAWFGIDTVKFDDWVTTDSILSEQFYGNSRSSRDQRSMRMVLPAAASVQLDVPFNENVFLNLSILQRIPFGPYSLRRANQVALTPRYESRHFEISMPFSFYEQFRPRIGLGLRFGILTIGTDMISPLLGITDSYGADLYFGLAWRSFKGCDGSGSGRGRRPNIENCKTPK
ncbi:MAG: hypothetical protein JNL88_02530 [Bacteroidia bacterium]|nr:hypothetical protein [Bacteroidia bacterium]